MPSSDNSLQLLNIIFKYKKQGENDKFKDKLVNDFILAIEFIINNISLD